MTIEIGERVDEAVKEGLRLVQQCHLWLTRASWKREERAIRTLALASDPIGS